jgi:hypothetical protein
MDDFDNAVVRHMRKRVTTRQNGQTKPMSLRDALLAKQAEVALKGSPYAIRHILTMDQRATEREAQERLDRRDAWARIKQSQERRLVAAIAKGEDTDLILPHPEDIVIDADDARVVGPCDAAELAACHEAMQLRDLLFLQQGLEDRLGGSFEGEDPGQTRPTSPLLFACFINGSLPQRLQLSKAAELAALRRASAQYTKRELLTLCHRGWAKLGVHRPRGAVLPGIGTCISYLDITLATLARIREAECNRLEIEDAFEDCRQRMIEELPLGNAAPVPQAMFWERGIL